MRMVTFRRSRECREVSINPAKVVYVCHYEHGASCIHFGKDCQIRVQGDVAEVVAKIEAAMNDEHFAASPASSKPSEGARPDMN